MTLTYFNDINVYFHMRNHYKSLRHVKSVVDTSLPQSLLKSPMAMSTLDKRMKAAANEHLRKIYNTTDKAHTPKRRGLVKKHDCLIKTAKSEASLPNSSSRPSTRRNSHATPIEPLPIKSLSMGPSKFGKIFKFKQKMRPAMTSNHLQTQSTSLQLDSQPDCLEKSDTNTVPNSVRSQFSEKSEAAGAPSSLPRGAEEHEYLLFLLRITEDIIANDFYSNSDIKKIFQNHMELNKERLNMRKMRLHIANLCAELNIECKEYQMPAEASSDESESPSKYQNSPKGHNYILNNKAFKNCQACSVIRTSSLYQMHSTDNLGDSLTEHIGESPSISPSLLKLLEKLSLGRVTECTESVASASPTNSPRLNYVIENKQINDTEDTKQDPMDFETFVKNLNSEEGVPIDDIASDQSSITENKEPENDILKTTPLSVIELDLDAPKASPINTRSNLQVTEEQIETPISASEKLEDDNQKTLHETEAELNATPVQSDSVLKTSKIPVLIKDSEPEQAPEIAVKVNTIKSVSSKASVTSSNVSVLSRQYKLEHVQSSVKNESFELPLRDDGDELISKEQIVLQDDKNNTCKVIKLIVQGAIKDDDFVMIKGPVYVYKPLLDSEPKLVLFADQKSRRSSVDSERSNRTFTVDHTRVPQQCDTSLYSVEPNNSMEHILELTRTAYSQFVDMKLLQSDYDLTPEKDDTDNKYHHLMVDGTTSISGVNITESLLLNDDYLVDNSTKGGREVETKMSGDMKAYVKFEPKMYENNYVIHRKLVSSSSMPTLGSNNERLASYRTPKGRNDGLRTVNVLKKCSGGLIDLDAPSQDSSLRSEGEALQNFEYRKNGIAWNVYLNKM